LFRNYMLDIIKAYCLKGFHKDARNKKAVYDIETEKEEIILKICD
jgi:hypothetical protein